VRPFAWRLDGFETFENREAMIAMHDDIADAQVRGQQRSLAGCVAPE
jgi:hypothetical protein